MTFSCSLGIIDEFKMSFSCPLEIIDRNPTYTQVLIALIWYRGHMKSNYIIPFFVIILFLS